MSNDVPANEGELHLQAYELRCQAHTFGLLARLWIGELDAAMLEELQDEPMRDAYQDVGGVVPDSQSCSTQDWIETLANEYHNCFHGPNDNLRPHQSMAQDNSFDGNCLDSMKTYVGIIGQPSGRFADDQLLDHAGVQLHLMQQIMTEMANIADSRITQPSPAMNANWASLTQLRDSFYEHHLRWLIAYCDNAIKQSNSQFYNGLFSVTRLLLGGD